MERRKVPWKAEWKAAGLDPGPLTDDELRLVPDLMEENRAFLAEHPREQRAKPPRISPLFWAVPLAAAALFAVVAVPLSVPSPSTGERIKGSGSPALTVYRQAKSGAEKLSAKALVRPGDLLQAAYQVSSSLQGALVSVDGDSNVTIHLAQGGHSIALTPGAEHRLDFSYELDRAPKYEVFFLLTSPRPFDLEPIRKLLKQSSWENLKAGAFGPGVSFVVFPLTKEVSP